MATNRIERALRIGLATSALAAVASVAGWAGGQPSERCALAKLAAAREFTGCVLKAQEKSIRKPGSANALPYLQKLTQRFAALEARVGAEVCPGRSGLGFVTEAAGYAQEVDLAIRPPKELIVFDAGPASGFELWMEGPGAQCGPGNREELSCRRGGTSLALGPRGGRLRRIP